MWKNIADLVLRNEKPAIRSVIFNNVEYKENSRIANEFNHYFIDSIKEIRDNIGIV